MMARLFPIGTERLQNWPRIAATRSVQPNVREKSNESEQGPLGKKVTSRELPQACAEQQALVGCLD